MKMVTASWISDEDGSTVGVSYEMSDIAIHDMIRLMENASGNENYAEGDFAGDSE